jgi:hypothetical protein
MNERFKAALPLKPALPFRVGALLTVTPSIRVRVLAMTDALQIHAPFGKVTVPYSAITRVTRDTGGRITLEMSGATMRLDCSRLPEMALKALVDLLEGKR